MKAAKHYGQKRISERHERLAPVETGDCGSAFVLATWPDGSYGVASATDARQDRPERYKRQSDALAAVYAANELDSLISEHMAAVWPEGRAF